MKIFEKTPPPEIVAAVERLISPYGEWELVRKSESAPAGPQRAWISRDEAAQYACLSKDSIDDLIKRGVVKAAKLGSARCSRVIIDRDSLDRFIKSRMVRVK